MKQPCARIVGLIFAAGITAVFGMGNQPVSEPTVKKATSKVDATAIYNQGVALMHGKNFAAAIADFEAAVKAKQKQRPGKGRLLVNRLAYNGEVAAGQLAEIITYRF